MNFWELHMMSCTLFKKEYKQLHSFACKLFLRYFKLFLRYFRKEKNSHKEQNKVIPFFSLIQTLSSECRIQIVVPLWKKVANVAMVTEPFPLLCFSALVMKVERGIFIHDLYDALQGRLISPCILHIQFFKLEYLGVWLFLKVLGYFSRCLSLFS